MFFWGDKNVLKLERSWLYIIETAQDDNELYTLKWLIVCYVKFTSIFKTGKVRANKVANNWLGISDHFCSINPLAST